VHELNVQVEVLVVHKLEQFTIHELLQLAQIQDVPGALVNTAFYRNVQYIVVPVPVRVVAFPEEALIFGVGEVRIEDAMRRVEPDSARYGHYRHGTGR